MQENQSMEKIEKQDEKEPPEGYRLLQEGKAKILYIEQKMEKDEQNRVKGGK